MKSKVFNLILVIFLTAGLASAQSGKKIRLTGRITDADNAPVTGVLVFADQVNTGKVTGKNGYFKIKIPAGTKLIRIKSSTGEFAESPVNGRNEVNIVLPGGFKAVVQPVVKKESGDYKEEEVNVGYGRMKKSELVTPVTKLDGEKQKFVYRSIYDMLRTMPGVQVNGTSIKIQGAESFMSSTEPLLVVDGMVVSTIDDIVPEFVKSIDILKGSSASIYGSRGANGVILITLKGSR